MDPINPWLDPAEVRRLAERLMVPPREAALNVGDPGFDGDFVGYDASTRIHPTPPSQTVSPSAPESPLPEAESYRFQAAPPRATDPVPPPEPDHEEAASPSSTEPERHEPEAADPSPPPADHPPPPTPADASSPVETNGERGPFLERVKHFRNWMHEQFSATGIFILDREGSVIFDESGHGRLHFMARSLALASRRPGATGGNVHVKVGAGATFEVIPVDTAYGCLVLGAVVPQSLSPVSVTAVMEALAMIASPRGGDS